MKNIFSKQNGATLILVLVFTSIFMVVAIGLLQLVGTLYKTAIKKTNLEQTFQIAEAGINFYKWRLAHSPDDYTGGGSYDYTDPYGGVIGRYVLAITQPQLGSSVVTVTSTGYLNKDPNITRTIEARFGRKSLSDFTFLTHSNIWFGPEEEVVGKTHSNGGIRFDGESDSIVQSNRDNYICGPEHGCNYETHPGVWGQGEIQALWHYPPAYQVPYIDFNSVGVDLSALKTKANTPTGFYRGLSGNFGYHIRFKTSPSAFDLYRVTNTYATYGRDFIDGWQWRYIDIQSESLIGTYSLPANGIIFLEDNVWVDGTLDGRVTLAAANFLQTGSDRSIIINNNITYKEKDGTDALGLIAQKDILLPLYSPKKLEIDAALFTQKGHDFIYNYQASRYGSNVVLKDMIEVYGSIASNTTWTWSWVNSQGQVISGYQQTETTFDPNLIYAPPPDFPHEADYSFISWREVK